MARTANRQAASKMAAPSRLWLVAFYIRLSREDKRGQDESESIANQRLILTDFLEQQEDKEQYFYAGEYVDDGVSGTTDENRGNFQRLLRDIQKGAVNCVVVKNLARSFRNSGDQSYYLEDWFPRHNVRFISLYQQPVDTYKDPQNAQSIAVPVQGVLNEEHARGTSESVRKTFDKKREKGLHIGSFAAYGYQKDPQNKNALLVDRDAALHVKNIYSWFLEGMSKKAIVRRLNDSGVLCPSAYKQSIGLKYQNPRAKGTGQRPLWCAVTVGSILKNRIYTGDMVQGRWRIKSYKIHVQEAVPESEWFIAANTHEPIINREIFAKVQALLKKDTRTAPAQKSLYLFSGLLRCADCGKAMTRSKVGKNVYYYCRTYKDRSKTACTKHTIGHPELEQGVLYAVQAMIFLAVKVPALISLIQNAPSPQSRPAQLDELLAAKQKELGKMARYRQSIYQDWKDGEISREDYQYMREDYDRQSKALNETVKNLQAKREAIGDETENAFLDAFFQHENLSQLSRDVLIELVDQITIYEKGNISIRFTFSV